MQYNVSRETIRKTAGSSSSGFSFFIGELFMNIDIISIIRNTVYKI